MSEYAPGSYHLADNIRDAKVKDALRDARLQALQRQAQAGRERRRRFYFGVLVWLGNHLTAWGERLQERYSTDGSAPMPQSA